MYNYFCTAFKGIVLLFKKKKVLFVSTKTPYAGMDSEKYFQDQPKLIVYMCLVVYSM